MTNKETKAMSKGKIVIKKRTTRSPNEVTLKSKKSTPPPPPPPPPPINHLIIPASLLNTSKFSKQEQHFLDSLDEHSRTQLLNTFYNVTEKQSAPIRFRVLNSKLPNKYEIVQRLQSCESQKFELWAESALKLPIGMYSPPPVLKPTNEEISLHLKKTRQIMDDAVYSQYAAKDEILRLICQWTTSGKLCTSAIGFEGPPGIGKTTFAKKALSSSMNRPFCFISLGGMADASSLVGHSFTYEGAICGRIAESIKECGVMNPILYFDELDKISKTPKGDEIISTLIHLTDKEQNSHFRDRYFHGIDLDLSNALVVFSYNNPFDINPILLDRMNIVQFNTPTVEEKVAIAQKHLIPRAIFEIGLQKSDVTFTDSTVEYIISNYTKEMGVRALDRALFKILGTLNVTTRVSNDKTTELDDITFPCNCNEIIVSLIMGQHNVEHIPYHLMSMYT